MRRSWRRPSSLLERYFGVVIAFGLIAGLSLMAMLGFTP
jgi:hypothetical protein